MTNASTSPTELRSLFLFQDLPEEQLAWLSARTQERAYAEGSVVLREGELARYLFVLLDGGLRRLRRAGRDDVLLTETSRRGVFVGAVRPFIGPEGSTYDSTVVTTSDARFLCLPAHDFSSFLARFAPMTVHLVNGTYTSVRDNDATMREREYVTHLGALSAGLAHELNNPAAAILRASAVLQERTSHPSRHLSTLLNAGATAADLSEIVSLFDHLPHADPRPHGHRGAVDRLHDEDTLLDLLENLDVPARERIS